MKNEFTAIIQDGGNGWLWAWSPEVPGANGQGRTEPEVLEDLAAAIELMLDCMRDDALKDLSPDARQETVTVG